MNHLHSHYANAVHDGLINSWVSDTSLNNSLENNEMQHLAGFDASGHLLEPSNDFFSQVDDAYIAACQQNIYGRSIIDDSFGTTASQYDRLSEIQRDFSTTIFPDSIQMNHFGLLNDNDVLDPPLFSPASNPLSHVNSHIPYSECPSSPSHSTTTKSPHREQDHISDHGIEKEATIGSLLTNGKFVCSNKDCARLTFGRSTELKRHHMTHHSVDKIEFWCHVPFCKRNRSGKGKPFYRKDKLMDHVRTVHPGVGDHSDL